MRRWRAVGTGSDAPSAVVLGSGVAEVEEAEEGAAVVLGEDDVLEAAEAAAAAGEGGATEALELFDRASYARIISDGRLVETKEPHAATGQMLTANA